MDELSIFILASWMRPLSVWTKSSSNIMPVTAWTDVFSTVMIETVLPEATVLLNVTVFVDGDVV
jgi:hypothetical protein